METSIKIKYRVLRLKISRDFGLEKLNDFFKTKHKSSKFVNHQRLLKLIS